MVMFRKVKTFQVWLTEPDKVYSSGEKVAGRVLLEVAEVTRVSAVRVQACGRARVNWAKGPQQCRQEMQYLRYEDVLSLEEQPEGGCGGAGGVSGGQWGGGGPWGALIGMGRGRWGQWVSMGCPNRDEKGLVGWGGSMGVNGVGGSMGVNGVPS